MGTNAAETPAYTLLYTFPRQSNLAWHSTKELHDACTIFVYSINCAAEVFKLCLKIKVSSVLLYQKPENLNVKNLRFLLEHFENERLFVVVVDL